MYVFSQESRLCLWRRGVRVEYLRSTVHPSTAASNLGTSECDGNQPNIGQSGGSIQTPCCCEKARPEWSKAETGIAEAGSQNLKLISFVIVVRFGL